MAMDFTTGGGAAPEETILLETADNHFLGRLCTLDTGLGNGNESNKLSFGRLFVSSQILGMAKLPFVPAL